MLNILSSKASEKLRENSNGFKSHRFEVAMAPIEEITSVGKLLRRRQMLVLSRKAGQEILIGDNISIVVNKISGDRVSIAIKAPEEVRILRGELKSFAECEENVQQDVLPLASFLPSNSMPASAAG